jgi:hypothetical protein
MMNGRRREQRSPLEMFIPLARQLGKVSRTQQHRLPARLLLLSVGGRQPCWSAQMKQATADLNPFSVRCDMVVCYGGARPRGPALLHRRRDIRVAGRARSDGR